MWDATRDFAEHLLGLNVGPDDLSFTQMAWRAFIVFSFAVLLARVAARRFLGNIAGFDIMLIIILGSVVSRAINGQAAFFPSLGAAALLVALHHVLATVAFRWHWFSKLVKGTPQVLVRDGRRNEDELRRARITNDDLDESVRLSGGVRSLQQIAEARLERNGTISVVRNTSQRGKPAGGAEAPAVQR
jgi:uncharacterized membrane protein YcaP (DUF421 family)